MDILVKTPHPEPLKLVHYWEKEKTQSRPLLIKRERLQRRQACHTLSKVLHTSSATVRVVPDISPVKSPSNSIRHNRQKICSWSRRLKTALEIRKKTTFLSEINNPIIYKLFKDFTNHRKKTNRAVVFSSRPFPKFLNTGTTDETFQTIWKTRHLLKSSANM